MNSAIISTSKIRLGRTRGTRGFLREGRCALSPCDGNSAEEAIVGSEENAGESTGSGRIEGRDRGVRDPMSDALAATHPSVAPRSSQNSAPVHV